MISELWMYASSLVVICSNMLQFLFFLFFPRFLGHLKSAVCMSWKWLWMWIMGSRTTSTYLRNLYILNPYFFSTFNCRFEIYVYENIGFGISFNYFFPSLVFEDLKPTKYMFWNKKVCIFTLLIYPKSLFFSTFNCRFELYVYENIGFGISHKFFFHII